jgi:hypothetical protein
LSNQIDDKKSGWCVGLTAVAFKDLLRLSVRNMYLPLALGICPLLSPDLPLLTVLQNCILYLQKLTRLVDFFKIQLSLPIYSIYITRNIIMAQVYL